MEFKISLNGTGETTRLLSVPRITGLKTMEVGTAVTIYNFCKLRPYATAFVSCLGPHAGGTTASWRVPPGGGLREALLMRVVPNISIRHRGPTVPDQSQ